MRVSIAAPASIANLGPGFDILALAVQLQNEVRCAARDDASLHIDPGDDASGPLRDTSRNLVTRAYTHACNAIGVTPPGADFTCVNRIPFARGLGSSAAAALSGVLCAVALTRAPWDEHQVISCAAELEGHRDNVAAAMLGGLAICAPGAPAVQMQVPDELRAIVVVPAARVRTEEARRAVPLTFSREDAVFNAARCALLVRALAARDWLSLGDAMDDRWHQPARTTLMPWLPRIVTAARDAGAAGAALAGAGPSVVALAVRDHANVSTAMQQAAADAGIEAEVVTLSPRNFGTRVDVRP
ncbi:MAG: homoserine kinase [Candidatus Dormibacteria bacterium]